MVTHTHPDHIGLAGWLVRHKGADLCISRTPILAVVGDDGDMRPYRSIQNGLVDLIHCRVANDRKTILPIH